MQQEEAMSDISVYTKPTCVQCDATKRALNKAGVAYDVVDVTEDAAGRKRIMDLGYLQAPVVIAGKDHWGGFRPDRIKALHAPKPLGERIRKCAAAQRQPDDGDAPATHRPTR